MNNDVSENKELNSISLSNNNNNLFEIKKNNYISLLFLKIRNSIVKGYNFVIFLQILIFIYFIILGKLILTNIFQLKINQENAKNILPIN